MPAHQKPGCDLCADDKISNRADVLTRHYLVYHPNVEFPGKQGRCGGPGQLKRLISGWSQTRTSVELTCLYRLPGQFPMRAITGVVLRG
jgi:hypothetical protein